MLLKCKYKPYFYQMKRALQVLEDNEIINSERHMLPLINKI